MVDIPILHGGFRPTNRTRGAPLCGVKLLQVILHGPRGSAPEARESPMARRERLAGEVLIGGFRSFKNFQLGIMIEKIQDSLESLERLRSPGIWKS